MTRDEILYQLRTFADYHAAEEFRGSDVFAAFCKMMKDRQYGGPETVQAWFIFKDAWIACANYQANFAASLVAKSLKP